MKKKIFTLTALALLAVSSCTKKSASTSTSVTPMAPISTFDITFNGKTFNVTTSDNTSSVSASTGTQSASGASTWFSTSVGASNSKIDASIFGRKSDLSTALGSYDVSANPSSANTTGYNGTVSITDYTDGGKEYTCQDSTTSSSVTISISNSTEIKGTFKILLTYNGVSYPATGDFDYNY